MWCDTFQIQCYKQNIGHYVYHHDFSCASKSHRVLTYLWYLNDVAEGGETEFLYQKCRVKPTKNRLKAILMSSFG